MQRHSSLRPAAASAVARGRGPLSLLSIALLTACAGASGPDPDGRFNGGQPLQPDGRLVATGSARDGLATLPLRLVA